MSRVYFPRHIGGRLGREAAAGHREHRAKAIRTASICGAEQVAVGVGYQSVPAVSGGPAAGSDRSCRSPALPFALDLLVIIRAVRRLVT
jgi:hypothetical protein